ncbi:MAG: chlorite dismutase family protein [Xanthobacteraceae bacterium]
MPNRFAFVGGQTGRWHVRSMQTVRGLALADALRLDIVPAQGPVPSIPAAWTLHGLISNVRYATRAELTALQSKQQMLNRPTATRAALIPITKSAEWWALAQDERRTIFEDRSRHTAIGLQYLPAIARQLYHCRDVGEPFDFLTWFEYAPEHAEAFEELVGALRATVEWTYVEREIDIRLERE